MKRWFRFRFSEKVQQGAALLIVTLFMTSLLGFAALTLDLGAVWLQRARVQEGIDAAALASVRDWASGADDSTVIQVAYDYAEANGVRAAEILAVEPGIWQQTSRTFVGPLSSLPPNTVPAVRIVARRVVSTPFWKAVSFGTSTNMRPRVEAIAVAGRARAATGVLPWAACDTFSPSRCVPITLQFKDGGETNACSGGGPLSGNFGQLTLPGGSGASWYRQNIAEGYQGVLRVGQCFNTDPGVSWGPTRQGLNDRLGGLPAYACTSSSPLPTNRRLGIVPKVTELDVSGKKPVCITGFYVVVLDGYDNGKRVVHARFLEAFSGTEVDPSLPPLPGELAGVALVR